MDQKLIEAGVAGIVGLVVVILMRLVFDFFKWYKTEEDKLKKAQSVPKDTVDIQGAVNTVLLQEIRKAIENMAKAVENSNMIACLIQERMKNQTDTFSLLFKNHEDNAANRHTEFKDMQEKCRQECKDRLKT